MVIYNGATYYYVTNLQGDVIGILDADGNCVVSYRYDTWGNIVAISASSCTDLVDINPLRYRGYVYDWETGLYYLQSRYYNPAWGRFINADSFISTGQGPLGNNMFAYCNNNPVRFSDETGEAPVVAIIIIAACVIAGGTWGFTRKTKLGSKIPKQEVPKPPQPLLPNQPLPSSSNDSVTPSSGDDTGAQVPTEELSLGDRLENTVIGAGVGLLAGGGLVMLAGVAGTVAVGSATTYIGALGGTGAQTFAIGALAYDLFATVVAPFFGVELEPIEIEPQPFLYAFICYLYVI